MNQHKDWRSGTSSEQDEADNARADYLDAEQPDLRALLVKALAALEPFEKSAPDHGRESLWATLKAILNLKFGLSDLRLARTTAAEIREGLGRAPD